MKDVLCIYICILESGLHVHNCLWHRKSNCKTTISMHGKGMVCVIKSKDVAYILLLLWFNILIVDSRMKVVWIKLKIGFQDV